MPVRAPRFARVPVPAALAAVPSVRTLRDAASSVARSVPAPGVQRMRDLLGSVRPNGGGGAPASH